MSEEQQQDRPKERDDVLRAKIDKVAQALGYDRIKLYDGFDGALVGIGTRFIYPVAIYNYDVCIKMLAVQNYENARANNKTEYTEEDALLDAEEYMSHNTTGAHVGEDTPVFVRFTTDVLDNILEDLA